MVSVLHRNPDIRLLKYIRKISLLKSNGKLNFSHKLTPSAFTYLSYIHEDIPLSVIGNKKYKHTKRLQIAGPKIDEIIRIKYQGQLHQILLEFTGSGFYYIFHVSPSELINKQVELTKFISSDIYVPLEDELQNENNFDIQVSLLEEFLLEKLAVALPFNEYIEKSLQIIEQCNGSVSVSDLAEKVGISERQFDRKFREIVGLSPKSYAKIFQLHYVINLMQSKKFETIQELAFRAEFYDLAHFINRFKKLTGLTPNEFINSDKHIALKYFTDLID